MQTGDVTAYTVRFNCLICGECCMVVACRDPRAGDLMVGAVQWAMHGGVDAPVKCARCASATMRDATPEEKAIASAEFAAGKTGTPC